MFKRILLPVDGSQLAEMALPYGEEMGRKLGSELILFHVCGREQQLYKKQMHRIYLDSLAKYMEDNIRRGQPEGLPPKVQVEVETGEPQKNICNLIEKKDIDLIIMTAVGTSGLQAAKRLGSVADHICSTVRIPVMLIKPQDAQRVYAREPLISRILLPLDGSDFSKLALPLAEELAARLNASIILFQMVRVIFPFPVDVMGTDVTFYSEIVEQEQKRVQAEMITLERELRNKGLSVARIVTYSFSAADEIIEAGKELDADLIVMSTHGRSGLRRLALGSVAEKVLRHGDIPVLLVNARASSLIKSVPNMTEQS
jgi:nucleotide-binding universal stress UspA family protein